MLEQERESSAHHSTVCSVARVREHPGHLATRYREVRNLTETLARPLSAEDQTIQSMPEASPTKWHRAHTTWFFETFVLVPHATSCRIFDEAFGYIFNSYYESVGPRHGRPSRGLLSRPGIGAVTDYRAHVDAAMERLLISDDPEVVDGQGWDLRGRSPARRRKHRLRIRQRTARPRGTASRFCDRRSPRE